MEVMESEQERIPLSALNQYAYCPRRCYLIHAEGEFTDNVHTIRGTHDHQQVDGLHHAVVAGVRVQYALPVWSDRLGLSGRCDVVEFHPDGRIYPVEYKHGRRHRWINDDIQLAAQAMCLEEMTGKVIDEGAIYHRQSRRRRAVRFDDSLRETVVQTAKQVHQVLTQGIAPPPVTQRQRCRECSLRELCRPDMLGDSRLAALRETLFDVSGDWGE